MCARQMASSRPDGVADADAREEPQRTPRHSHEATEGAPIIATGACPEETPPMADAV